MSDIDWDTFAADAAEQALDTLLWSSSDEGIGNFEDYADSVSDELKAEILADVKDYLSINEVQKAITHLNINAVTVGHNFYLSANGHGTGFWDRGYGAWGDKLHGWAKNYQRDVFLNGDGLVY